MYSFSLFNSLPSLQLVCCFSHNVFLLKLNKQDKVAWVFFSHALVTFNMVGDGKLHQHFSSVEGQILSCLLVIF